MQFDGKSTLGKFITGSVPPSPTHVLRGELLVEITDSEDYNYQLYRDPSVYLLCTEDDVAQLSHDGFHVLGGVKEPVSRLDVFRNKFEWETKVWEGFQVLVTISWHIVKKKMSNAKAKFGQ